MQAIRIPMPLSGMDPVSLNNYERENRLASQDRSFRMSSEGELFYVDTDLHEDALGVNRHDHGHLGGVSLEEITRFMAAGKPVQALVQPESIAETESASRSSSQDSTYGEDPWQINGEKPMATAIMTPMAMIEGGNTAVDTDPCSLFVAQAREWDHAKLDDALLVHRTQQQSVSETAFQDYCEFYEPLRDPTDSSSRSAVLDYPQGDSSRNDFDRALDCLFGGRRVESISRHFSSCTSTKTFDMPSSGGDRALLTRFGVAPDLNGALGAEGTVTFTMHIAGHRVISSFLGRHVEYEIRIKGARCSWSRWLRFSRFKALARYTDKDPCSARAWCRVTSSMPHFRCLHPDYIAHKCRLLEMFLQQVMFALPTPALLLQFVTDN